MKLTVKIVEGLIKAAADKEYRDDACPGLILRVRKSSWRWEIRWSPGRAFSHRRRDLGNDLTLDDARHVADKFRAIVRAFDGYTPDYIDNEFNAFFKTWRLNRAGVKYVRRTMENRPAPPSISYRAAIEEYGAELRRTRREKTAADYVNSLRRRDFQKLLDRPVRDIKRTEMAGIIAKIHKSHERQAETVATAVRGMWKFLARDDMRSKTGVDPHEMRDLSTPERSLVEDDDAEASTHVPDRDEIGRLARWFSRPVPQPAKDATKRDLAATVVAERDRLASMLVIYTVQRVRAVAHARCVDFEDLKDGTALWRIGPAHRKSASMAARRGHDVGVHIVPLPPSAWAVVKRAMALSDDSPYLFPGARSRRVGSEVTTLHESSLSHFFAEVPGCEASPHDMRRALGTTFRKAAGYTTGDVGLILDHGKREDMDGEDITAEFYAFSTVGKKAWAIMREWCDFIDAATAEQNAEENI